MFIAMKKLTFILLVALMVTGCSNSLTKTPELPKMPKLSLPSWAKPKMPSIDVYKPTIMQGSVLDMSDVNQLQLGMSKDYVVSLIGSPAIVDSFSRNQWNYIHQTSIGKEQLMNYRLILTFDDNFLTEIDKSGLESLSADK
jgi:outer membrane protein assembly factor BamE